MWNFTSPLQLGLGVASRVLHFLVLEQALTDYIEACAISSVPFGVFY
jgi:hypothetical protein